MSAKITGVIKNSIAEELEIKAGSVLLSINGNKLRDYIDYQYMITTEELEFEIQTPEGEQEVFEIIIEDFYLWLQNLLNLQNIKL